MNALALPVKWNYDFAPLPYYAMSESRCPLLSPASFLRHAHMRLLSWRPSQHVRQSTSDVFLHVLKITGVGTSALHGQPCPKSFPSARPHGVSVDGQGRPRQEYAQTPQQRSREALPDVDDLATPAMLRACYNGASEPDCSLGANCLPRCYDA